MKQELVRLSSTDNIEMVGILYTPEENLNSIDIPVLVVFGDIDECVLTQDITTVKNYLNNNIKKCNIQIIEGANHSYTNKYEELGNIIENNI